jgi:hypothetical protein
MWLATKHGFFSIVKKGGKFHVRARVRRDLENLVAVAHINADIIESATTDYRYRIFVDGAGLGVLMMTLATTLDYGNFKGHIHDLPDQADKSEAYANIWGLMAQMQWRNQE